MTALILAAASQANEHLTIGDGLGVIGAAIFLCAIFRS